MIGIADARAELERIVSEIRQPEARDRAYYRTILADYVALLMRPEVKADDNLLIELIHDLDRMTAAYRSTGAP
jgi:DNA-binding Lrp family transcriptional regulator